MALILLGIYGLAGLIGIILLSLAESLRKRKTGERVTWTILGLAVLSAITFVILFSLPLLNFVHRDDYKKREAIKEEAINKFYELTKFQPGVSAKDALERCIQTSISPDSKNKDQLDWDKKQCEEAIWSNILEHQTSINGCEVVFGDMLSFYSSTTYEFDPLATHSLYACLTNNSIINSFEKEDIRRLNLSPTLCHYQDFFGDHDQCPSSQDACWELEKEKYAKCFTDEGRRLIDIFKTNTPEQLEALFNETDTVKKKEVLMNIRLPLKR